MDDKTTKAYKSMTQLAMRLSELAKQHVLLSESFRQSAVDLREAAEALRDETPVTVVFDAFGGAIIELDGVAYDLLRTCESCPEQYEVTVGEDFAGYLRLRHGEFTAEFPDSGGDLVYSSQPEGDGIFEEDEREQFLVKAVSALHRRRSTPPAPEAPSAPE